MTNPPEEPGIAPEHQELVAMLQAQIAHYGERAQGIYRRVERTGVPGAVVPDQMVQVCRRLELPEPVVVRADAAPVLSVVVDAEQAEDAWAGLCEVFRETGYWPLLMSGIEYEEEIPELLWDHGGTIGDAAVAAARSTAVAAVLDVSDEGSSPGFDTGSESPDLEIDNVGGDDPTGEVFLVPVEHPSDALGQLGFGGGNAGWSPAEHTVVSRWLSESLGVVPMMVGVDRVGFFGTTRAHPPAEGHVIAARLNQYCSDAVGEDDLDAVTAALAEARGLDLRLWWD